MVPFEMLVIQLALLRSQLCVLADVVGCKLFNFEGLAGLIGVGGQDVARPGAEACC